MSGCSSCPYPSPLIAVSAAIAGRLDASQETAIAAQWSFLLDAVESLPERAIVHVPRIVARLEPTAGGRGCRWAGRPHRAARGSRALSIAGRKRRCGAARVSVAALRVEDRVPDLDRDSHAGSLSAAGALPARDHRRWVSGRRQIVDVDNGSADPRIAALPQRFAGRLSLGVVPMPVPFNFPSCATPGWPRRGAASSSCSTTTPKSGRAGLAELGFLVRDDVGAVGPLLLYPDGLVQSAGVLLGVKRGDQRARELRVRRSGGGRVVLVATSCERGARRMPCRRSRQVPARGGARRALRGFRTTNWTSASGWRPRAWRAVHAVRQRRPRGGRNAGFEVTGAERQRLEAEELLFHVALGRGPRGDGSAHHPSLSAHRQPVLAGKRSDGEAARGWRSAVRAPRASQRVRVKWTFSGHRGGPATMARRTKPAFPMTDRPRVDILNFNFYDWDGDRVLIGGAERYVLELARWIGALGAQPRIVQNANRYFSKVYADVPWWGCPPRRRWIWPRCRWASAGRWGTRRS